MATEASSSLQQRRRARARALLLSGGSGPAAAAAHTPPALDPVTANAARTTKAAFSNFCGAALALGVHSPATVQGWAKEIGALSSEAERHTYILNLLDYVLRGCRVRITESRLLGCEGVVLLGERTADGRVPVRVTVHDGSTEELTLRPTHLQLLQGRREVEVAEVEAAAAAEAEKAQVDAASRAKECAPRAMHAALETELKLKSFAELRVMAEKMDAYQLLHNPLLQYDRASFREGLAELLSQSDDGGSVAIGLLESAGTRGNAPGPTTPDNGAEFPWAALLGGRAGRGGRPPTNGRHPSAGPLAGPSAGPSAGPAAPPPLLPRDGSRGGSGGGGTSGSAGLEAMLSASGVMPIASRAKPTTSEAEEADEGEEEGEEEGEDDEEDEDDEDDEEEDDDDDEEDEEDEHGRSEGAGRSTFGPALPSPPLAEFLM